MSRTKRNGNVEILRFLFCLLIVFHHFEKPVFGGELFTAAYLGVEFFFILTGVFLGKKLKADKEKNRAESFGAAAKEGAEHVWKRICGIFPYYFLAAVIGLAARLFVGINNPTPSELVTFLGDFGFVQLLGISCLSTTGVMWYLCALFFALLLIYPFVRKYYDGFVYSFALLFPPFIIGTMTKNTGNLGAIKESLFGVFNIGILRAVAMISIGLVVNELTDRIKALPVNRLTRAVFTACELILYPVIFAYLIFVGRCGSDYWIVVLMALVLIITLSERSIFFGKFDNRFAMFLGKSSMIVFMCHFFWVQYISYYLKRLPAALPKGRPTAILLGLALTAVTSVIVYFGGKLLRFLFRKVKAALFAPPKNAA